jgi:hypothetical protein
MTGLGTPGQTISADPGATALRLHRLRRYMDGNVLGPQGFCCSSFAECKASIRRDDVFTEGQLSHVGHHYDLTLDGKPLRIVVVGQEYGVYYAEGSEERASVSIDQRYEIIVGGSGWRSRYYADRHRRPRNPHMRGTTSALRIIFGKGLGADREGEFVDTIEGERFHIFDAFALVNVLLCSAHRPGTSEGRSSPTMQRNCLRHFSSTLEILEPSLVVLQGKNLQQWTSSVFQRTQRLSPYLAVGQIAGMKILLCEFSHPSAHGPLRWGDSLSAQYLSEIVAPTLDLAVASLDRFDNQGL